MSRSTYALYVKHKCSTLSMNKKRKHPLEEFIDREGLSVTSFAKKVKACRGTIYRVFTGKYVHLPLAKRIHTATREQVPLSCLRPEKN